jgi:phosphoserine phosphatase
MHLPWVAVSDWDNTLCAGFTIQPWSAFLAANGLFRREQLLEIEDCFDAFDKNRITYDQFCASVGKAYARGISGSRVDQIGAASEEFVKAGLIRVHTFSYKAASAMARHGVPFLLVSGAPLAPLHAFARAVGCIVAAGLEVAVTETSEYADEIVLNPGLPDVKARVLESIREQYDILIGFGDSIADRPLLESARLGVLVCLSERAVPELRSASIKRLSPQMLAATVDELIERQYAEFV